MNLEILKQLSQKTDSKIVLLVMDGLGGIPFGERGLTELEAAQIPDFDLLAAKSSLGLLDTVDVGITPGSGPGHLGLFGYDPFEYQVGRGIFSALGVGFALQPSDVAARMNFCTLDGQGNVTDRRAGRIPTSKCIELVALLQGIVMEGVECFVIPEQDYRAALIFRGKGMVGHLSDTDPQKTGVPSLPTVALSKDSEFGARIVNQFIAEVQKRLTGQSPANGALLRGFDSYKPLPTFSELYKLKSAAIPVYPMYKGAARLVGMDVLETGPTFDDQVATLKKHFAEYDYFYIHVKKTDSYGEDGNFDAKVKVIEDVSRSIPRILELNPTVFAVTGDHSTPARMKAHSWHPVPLLLHSPYTRRHRVAEFSETQCARGDLGRLPGKKLMSLLLANAGKLQKYGA